MSNLYADLLTIIACPCYGDQVENLYEIRWQKTREMIYVEPNCHQRWIGPVESLLQLISYHLHVSFAHIEPVEDKLEADEFRQHFEAVIHKNEQVLFYWIFENGKVPVSTTFYRNLTDAFCLSIQNSQLVFQNPSKFCSLSEELSRSLKKISLLLYTNHEITQR